MDNYPPGAAHDPNAPYNEEPCPDIDVTVCATLVKDTVLTGRYEHRVADYFNDLKEYFQNQYRTPRQIMECCQKIVKQLRKQGNLFFAGIDLRDLDEDCDYWEETEVNVE